MSANYKNIKVNPKNNAMSANYKNKPCPPAYPLGSCTDAWLSTTLSASLYLDAFLDAVRISLVTAPIHLFVGLVLVRLLVVGWLQGYCLVDVGC